MNFRRILVCIYSSAHAFSSKKKMVPPTTLSLPDLYIPKTKNQEKYVDALNNPNTAIIIAMGPAGTGKTLFACQKAITELKQNKIERIVITRPVVPVGEDLGFLPGGVVKKMLPWMCPIMDIFKEYYTLHELNQLIHQEKIEVSALSLMRGRSLRNSYVIADEMQNSIPSQMKMLATRLGENSRLIITGDLKQTDLKVANGLHDIVGRLERKPMDKIQCIYLGNHDIERSEIVKQVMELYEENDQYEPRTRIYGNGNGSGSGSGGNGKISIPTWRKLSEDLHIN